jgi:hypothetical protein
MIYRVHFLFKKEREKRGEGERLCIIYKIVVSIGLTGTPDCLTNSLTD